MNEPAGASRPDSAVYTRRRLVVATAAVLVPSLSYSLLRRGSVRSESTASSTIDAASSVPSIGSMVPESTVASTAVPLVAFDHSLAVGASGSKVTALQDRLRGLGFDPGPSDGLFGPATERAVWAFEKFLLDVDRADVTGEVTPEMWVRMNEPIEVRPRRANSGTHLEVLLPQQVAVLYVASHLRLITHVSSGSGEEWCAVVVVDNDDGTQSEQGICGVATTPGGVFHFERRVTGWRNSKLGRLYNPVYFNYGIAVHGASNVPSFPASRGCVRMPMHIAEYFPSLVDDGDLVYVFDGIKEPEDYGAQLPVFDYPDPTYTTTTTTTTADPHPTETSTVPPTTQPRPTPSTPTTVLTATTSSSPTTVAG